MIAAAGTLRVSPLSVMPSVGVQLLLGEPGVELSNENTGNKWNAVMYIFSRLGLGC